MQTIIDLAIYGIIQGLTEFLPVSSSGHLVIAQELLGYKPEGIALEIALHLATLLAVIILYWRKIIELVFRNNGKWGWIIFLLKLMVATVPAAIVGFLLKDQIEVMFEGIQTVGFALIFTSVVLFSTLFAKSKGKKINQVGFGFAFLIGCAQALAITPGISRAGMTIAVALWLGVISDDAAAFSFILSIPAIAGAALLQVKDFATIDVPLLPLGIAFVLSFAFGLLAIFLVIKSLKAKRFVLFGIYCAVVGITVVVISIMYPAGFTI